MSHPFLVTDRPVMLLPPRTLKPEVSEDAPCVAGEGNCKTGRNTGSPYDLNKDRLGVVVTHALVVLTRKTRTLSEPAYRRTNFYRPSKLVCTQFFDM